MADEINVQVKASIAGLQAAMAEASASVREFSLQAKEHVETVGTAFEALNGIMVKFAAVLAGGLFFKEAIESTEKWTGEVKNLSKVLGTSLEDASKINAALHLSGIATETYTSAAQKMDRQIRTNSGALEELGVKLKDSNGNLLPQQQLMMNAINTLRGYEEGTNRNIASQVIFGRGAGDVASLLKLTNEQMARGAEDAAKFGLGVDEEGVASAKRFKEALAEVNLQFAGIQRIIGEAIIPLLTGMAEKFNDNSVGMRSMVLLIQTMETAFIGLQTVVIAVVDAIGSYFAEMVVKFKSYTEQIADYATLNFTKANEAAKNGQVMLAATMAQAKADMAKDMADQAQMLAKVWDIDGLNGKPKTEKEKPAAKGKQVPQGLLGGGNGGADAEKAATQERIQLAQLETNTELQLSKIALATKKDHLAAEVAAGRISKTEEIQQLHEFATEEYNLDMAALNKEMQVNGISTVQKQKMLDAQLILTAKHKQDEAKLTAQVFEAEKAKYAEYGNMIKSSFNGMLTGILQGTQTFKQAIQNVFSNLASTFATSVINKMVDDWAKGEGAKTGATIAGNEARAAADKAGASEGLIAHLAKSIKQITADAATTYSNVFAFLSPELGPFAAVPAAGAAALVTAQIANVPSFDVGSWQIPRDMMANIHQGEMIIPKPFADSIRENGVMSGGGGNVIHLQINAMDAHSVRQLFMREGGALAKSLQNQIRNSNQNFKAFA